MLTSKCKKRFMCWKNYKDKIKTTFISDKSNLRLFYGFLSSIGDQYYRYNAYTGQIDNGYPRPLSVWGIPADRLDSAVQWFNRRTYFFADDLYYRYNDAEFQVDDGYPRPTAYWWFGCGDSNLEQMSTPTGGSLPTSLPSALALVLSAFLVVANLFWELCNDTFLYL